MNDGLQIFNKISQIKKLELVTIMFESSNISDEKRTETWLTKIDSKRSIIISLIFGIFTTAFLLFSYIPGSTIIHSGHSSDSISPVSTSYVRLEFDDFDPLSSIILLRLCPKFTKAIVDRSDITLKLKGKIILLNSDKVELDQVLVEQSYTYNIPKDFDGYLDAETFSPFHTVNFSSLFIYLDVTTVNEIIEDIQITSISVNKSVSIIGIVTISLITISNGVLLFVLISRRLPPIEKDQWLIIILTGILVIVDGPWLLSQYYGSSQFSQIFDIMPQLFHGFFIVYTFVFFSSKTKEQPRLIFNNKIILACIFLLSVIIIILEFAETGLKPLNVFAYYKTLRSDGVFYVLLILFILYHFSLIGSFLYGFKLSRFERRYSFYLVILMFFIMEITQIITFFVRIFVNEIMIGTSLAADIFYINEANLICFILLYLDTPLHLSDENTQPLMDQ